MKKLFLLIFVSILFSCSKSDECWCNASDGEYKYLSSSANVNGNTQFGDLKEECELEETRLKTNIGEESYCEMR